MVEPQEGKGKENEKQELTEEELMRTIKQILASQERQAKSQETVQQTPQTVEVFGFSCDADTSKGVLVGAVAFLCACLLPQALQDLDDDMAQVLWCAIGAGAGAVAWWASRIAPDDSPNKTEDGSASSHSTTAFEMLRCVGAAVLCGSLSGLAAWRCFELDLSPETSFFVEVVLNAALIVGLAHDSLLERVKSAKSVNVVMLLRVGMGLSLSLVPVLAALLQIVRYAGPPLVIGIVCFAVMVGGMYGLGRESLLGVVILYHIVHVISQEVSRARESSFA